MNSMIVFGCVEATTDYLGVAQRGAEVLVMATEEALTNPAEVILTPDEATQLATAIQAALDGKRVVYANVHCAPSARQSHTTVSIVDGDTWRSVVLTDADASRLADGLRELGTLAGLYEVRSANQEPHPIAEQVMAAMTTRALGLAMAVQVLGPRAKDLLILAQWITGEKEPARLAG